MKIFTKLFIIVVFLSVGIVNAQQKSIAVGAGVGLARGVNESKPGDRNLGPLFGI